ncbi:MULTISPECIES: hypothetical protein [Klebsiella]|uniref:hypothetical protein n=1 Tax=Klebsiella TaxID=570 RepID=UPI001BA1F886|nr:hypothetical protein [Klebsiella sp. CVUAS 11332]HBC9240724.1 hypothetical protein [Klebsiella oxytoca]HBR1444894.1 hypothetical protein [Klebsiella quasipneumoniae subsp. quasipneumoniae]HCI6101185.1 hypothetical protein [Klebsiella variicola subsp. variicola]HDZ9736196.1 hypothetical protein [Klebsiella pneumoniae]MBW6033110.1 hypothetical protein [Klebsiella sp. CVUAS 11332]
MGNLRSFVFRVNDKSDKDFNDLFSNNRLSNSLIKISDGSSEDYGPYFNQHVRVYVFITSDDDSFKQMPLKVQTKFNTKFISGHGYGELYVDSVKI